MLRPIAPEAVLWIARTLEGAGFDTWAVGGAIRDAVLGQASGDWDLATRARPREVRRLFKRTVPIGVEHGTVGVLARDGTMFEVTTFRRDVETDGRHAIVQFADTIDDDLARRDFTINAIAWHPLRDELYDPFDGVGDLDRGVLRTVGVATDRFREDYLRVLRAIRFAGRFELDIEADTWNSLRTVVDRLPNLSPERIRDELLKILGADPTPGRALEMCAESGVLRVLFSELEELRDATPALDRLSAAKGPPAPGGWAWTLRVVDRLPLGRPYLRLAALLRPLPADQVAAFLLRLRLSNAHTDEVARLAGAAPLPAAGEHDTAFRRWLSRHGGNHLNAVARLDLATARAEAGRGGAPSRCATVVGAWRRAREIRAANPPIRVADLAIDGRGLVRLGLRPGPRFGEILDGLLDWVLDDPARNEPRALESRALDIERRLSADASDG